MRFEGDEEAIVCDKRPELKKPKSKEEIRILVAIDKLKKRLTDSKALIWMPKAIAVSSAYPYYEFFDSILTDLYNRFHKPMKGK